MHVEINSTKSRQQYSINQRNNKHTYMNNKIIPSFLKTVFYTTKPNAKNYMFNYIWLQQKLWHHYKNIERKKCPKNLVNDQVYEVKNMESKQLLSTNKRAIPNRIPVSITYNRYLPNISNIIRKNRNNLRISPKIRYLTKLIW